MTNDLSCTRADIKDSRKAASIKATRAKQLPHQRFVEGNNAAELQGGTPWTIVQASYRLLVGPKRLPANSSEFPKTPQSLTGLLLKAKNTFSHDVRHP
jgi:hypothetical protein